MRKYVVFTVILVCIVAFTSSCSMLLQEQSLGETILQKFFSGSATNTMIMDGSSMLDTIHDNDTLLVTPYGNNTGEPQIGDVVICQFPDIDKNLVKRLIGLPGDTIEIIDNVVYRNGEPMDEPYLTPERNNSPYYANISAVELGENEYYVLGDNRDNSLDSRSEKVGLLARDQIIGRVQ